MDELRWDALEDVYLNHRFLPPEDATLQRLALPASFSRYGEWHGGNRAYLLGRFDRQRRRDRDRGFNAVAERAHDVSLDAILERGGGLAAMLHSNVPLMYFVSWLLLESNEEALIICVLAMVELMQGDAVSASFRSVFFKTLPIVSDESITRQADKLTKDAVMEYCFERLREPFAEFLQSEYAEAMKSDLGPSSRRPLYPRCVRVQAAKEMVEWLKSSDISNKRDRFKWHLVCRLVETRLVVDLGRLKSQRAIWTPVENVQAEEEPQHSDAIDFI